MLGQILPRSVTEAELIDSCRPHLGAYKLPRSVRFVADLPKTSTGKIMRRELGHLIALKVLARDDRTRPHDRAHARRAAWIPSGDAAVNEFRG